VSSLPSIKLDYILRTLLPLSSEFFALLLSTKNVRTEINNIKYICFLRVELKSLNLYPVT